MAKETQALAKSESKLVSTQVNKATKALLKHIHSQAPKKTKQNLLASDVDKPENDLPIWLSMTTKKFIIDKKRLKPARIPLAHPFVSPDATVCLFVKDPQRVYKDMVEQAGLSSVVTRVVGVSKLKEKHKSFEAKRALRDSHDMFMADDRVVSLLPGLLGKTFYAGKKNPLPIEVPKNPEKLDNLKIEVNKALRATHLHLSPGTCTMIKVGLAGQTPEQIAENIEIVANRVIDQFVPQKWKGLRSLHIKTAESVALPIWLTDEVFDPEVDEIATADNKQKIIEAPQGKQKKRIAGIELDTDEEADFNEEDGDFDEEPARKKTKVHATPKPAPKTKSVSTKGSKKAIKA